MNLQEPLILSVGKLAGKCDPIIVDKRWGMEHIYINGDGTDTRSLASYCMKILTIKPFSETSMHFHVNKHETLLVIEGKLQLDYLDGTGGKGSIVLEPGEAFVIPPGFMHKLCASEEQVLIVEASTPDNTEDSIRVFM